MPYFHGVVHDQQSQHGNGDGHGGVDRGYEPGPVYDVDDDARGYAEHGVRHHVQAEDHPHHEGRFGQLQHKPADDHGLAREGQGPENGAEAEDVEVAVPEHPADSRAQGLHDRNSSRTGASE